MPQMKKTQNPINRPSLLDLLRLTPSEVKKRARSQCRPLRKQYALGSREGFKRSRAKFPTYYNEQRVYSKCTDGKKSSYIRFFGPPDLNTKVWVWCDCEYFKYYLEVALANRNASTVRSSNGAPPRIRNPEQLTYLCKHLVLAANIGAKQSRDLVEEQLEKESSGKKEASFRVTGNKLYVPKPSLSF